MMKQNKTKEFLKSKLVEEIAPDFFKIRVNLKTREEGVDDIKVSREVVSVCCFNYFIQVSNDRDFNSIREAIKYQLLDVEENPKIIRQVLDYLDSICILIESILDYFKEDLEKKND